MKKEYESPTIEIVVLDSEAILETTSGVLGGSWAGEDGDTFESLFSSKK